MVAPEREMPGKSAMAWALPIIRAKVKFSFFSFDWKNSVENKRRPVKIRKIAGKVGLAKVISILSLNNKPMIPAGIDPMIIYKIKRRLVRDSILSLTKSEPIIWIILLPKKMSRAIVVPKWRKAL
jgi:hypothetical protein